MLHVTKQISELLLHESTTSIPIQVAKGILNNTRFALNEMVMHNNWSELPHHLQFDPGGDQQHVLNVDS